MGNTRHFHSFINNLYSLQSGHECGGEEKKLFSLMICIIEHPSKIFFKNVFTKKAIFAYLRCIQ